VRTGLAVAGITFPSAFIDHTRQGVRTMKLVSRLAIPAFAILLAGVGGTAPVNAQEIAALNVTLKQSYTKTATSFGDIDNQFMDALTPTTISCPQKGNCMVQIQLSAITQILWPYDEFIAAVTVDGQFANPSPGGTVVLRANLEATEDDNTQASTFTWVQVVKPGQHVVAVKVRANQHTLNLRERTLVISVFN
jgi:hypothetical protein